MASDLLEQPTIEQQRLIASRMSGARILPDQQFQSVHVKFAEGQDPANAPGRAMDGQYAGQLQSLGYRLAKTKVEAATVLNMLPFELSTRSTMPSVGPVHIAAAVEGKRFTSYTWINVAVEVQQIESNRFPLPYYPIQLAEGFADEFIKGSWGGVVVLNGYPTEEAIAESIDQIEAAEQKMVGFLMLKVNEANGYWNSTLHGQSVMIVEPHRASARKLFEMGRIPKLPDWIQPETKTAAVPVEVCPMCKVKPAAGAVACTSCGQILDIVGAYKMGRLDENSPELERLTRAQVEELGVSAYVAETSDEKPARLSKGLSRPLSKARLKELKSADKSAE